MPFLQQIKSNSVDLILIDPPYEISKSTNFTSGTPKGEDTDRFRVSMDFGEWDRTDVVDMHLVITECYRILKTGGTLICFYDLWKLSMLSKCFKDAKFKQIRFIEWIKTNPVPINSKINYLTNAREIAVLGIKNKKPTFNSIYDNGIYEEQGELYKFPICHDKDRFHTTQKPEDLITALIEKHSNEGDTVLDCFSGSGTTAVCAAKTNRIFIGCELKTDYYDKSVKRILKNNIKVRMLRDYLNSSPFLYVLIGATSRISLYNTLL